jgi:hypothetical protein
MADFLTFWVGKTVTVYTGGNPLVVHLEEDGGDQP